MEKQRRKQTSMDAAFIAMTAIAVGIAEVAIPWFMELRTEMLCLAYLWIALGFGFIQGCFIRDRVRPTAITSGWLISAFLAMFPCSFFICWHCAFRYFPALPMFWIVMPGVATLASRYGKLLVSEKRSSHLVRFLLMSVIISVFVVQSWNIFQALPRAWTDFFYDVYVHMPFVFS